LTDFQTFFTVRIRRKFVIIVSLKIPPHLKCVATLPCEMSSVLKATTDNKTTSVTTHFRKLTTRNVFIVLVIVLSNCHTMQFLYKMFNVFTFLLDDALLKCVVYRSRLVFSCCFKTMTFHKVAYRDTSRVVGSSVIVLLKTFSCFWKWKQVWKLVYIWWSHKTHKKCAKFLGHPVCCH